MATATTTSKLQDKFLAIEDGVNSRLVERSKEVRTAVTALAARVHHFQLGPPGVAKSLLVRTLVGHIEGFNPNDYFERLVTRFSTPEELFGPPSLSALKEDRYSIVTAHMLPEAKLAFVDEIFKANSSILNALLTIMNERKFFNEVPIDVPLASLFCASNELPQGEELEAMYDRIHFRHILRPIQEPGNFIQMLKGQMAGEITPVISWAEVEQAQAEVAAVDVPSDVLDAMNTLRNNLAKEGLEPTDRRFAESLKIIRATAWMAERDVADIDDMRLLQHVLWTTPNEKTTVDKVVLELANPLDKEATDLLEEINRLGTELDDAIRNADNKQVKNKKGIEIHGKLERAKEELDSLEKRAEQSGRKSEAMGEAKERLLTVTKTLLRDIFKIEQPS